MLARSNLVNCLIAAIALMLCLNVSAQEKRHYQVYLQDAEQAISLPIASIEFTTSNTGLDYQISMNEQQFGDYFLSMRPFKCMTDKVDMLCHLAYPYDLKRHIFDANLTALEYEFLFIRRKPTDYGINPWNGLYYRLHKQGEDYVGVAHEVDLDILAVPPAHNDPFPIKPEALHGIDAKQLWLPRLLIRAQ